MIMPGRSYSSDHYRFGFNGKENDNEVKGTGNSLDFGARIYDPRAVRWLSVDPYFKEYTSISPYVFSLNNPIIFKDFDGNYVVGADGNPVTYKISNGQVKWSSNATVDVKRIGNAMLKTATGRQIFDNMRRTKYGINMAISPKAPIDRLAVTTVHRSGKTNDIKSVDITIFEGSLLNAKNDFTVSGCTPKGVQGTLYAESFKRTGGIEEAIGANGVHEGIHASDPVNLKNQDANQRLGKSKDVESKPEQMETQYLLEVSPIEKMTPKTAGTIPAQENKTILTK